MVESQVKFNRVPKKIPEKVWGAEPGQVQQGSGKVSGEGLVRFNRVPEKVPALGLAARFRK